MCLHELPELITNYKNVFNAFVINIAEPQSVQAKRDLILVNKKKLENA